MRTLTIHTTGLTADTAKRTVTGVLLPYGELGATNLGRVSAAAGVTVADTVRANVGHDRNVPVGRLTSHEDGEAGISGTFSISRTPAGDALLAEIAEGDRDGLSVEIENPVIRDGVLSGGELSWVGFVTEPAFASARITAGASDATVNEDGSVTVTTDGTAVTVSVVPATEDEPPADAPPTETAGEDPPPDEREPEMSGTRAAVRPATAALTAGAGRDDRPAIASLRDFVNRWVNAKQSNDGRLMAALADITYSAVGVTIAQPQWIGELWSGIPYTRTVVPLINHDELTSLKIESWRWVTKPAVAHYAGDKTDVPSNAVDTENVAQDATRYAGAHDIDRALVDFPTPGTVESYYAAMTESYARLTDTDVATALLAAAPVVAPGTVPSGISAAAAALVDAALSVVDTAPPTFALVAKDVYRDLLLTPRESTLELLSQSLGLDGGDLAGFRIVPRPEVPAGTVLVGVRSAATFYELGGGAPIRVQALDVARGGVDAAVFGYGGTVIHDVDGLAKTTIAGTPLTTSRKSADK